MARSPSHDGYGAGLLAMLAISSATPLTVSTAVVIIGIAVTGLISLPVAFLLIAAVLALFSPGYMQMARRLPNAGAFYAYIATMSRPLGLGAALLAQVSYFALYVGLYATMGVMGSTLLPGELPWWLVAFLAWIVVLLMGRSRLQVSGVVLRVLVFAEITLMLVYGVANLVAAPQIEFSAFNPLPLVADFSAAGPALALATLGFVGFEQPAIYSETVRSPRTLSTATVVTLAALAGVYSFSSWSTVQAVGAEQVVERSAALGPELLFTLAEANLGGPAADLGRFLLFTSVLAALISFNNASARYLYALGREFGAARPDGIWSRLGTQNDNGQPQVAVYTLGALALLVIAVVAVLGVDPLQWLFYLGGTTGGVGVTMLIALSALAIPAYLRREAPDLSPAARTVLPWAAVVATWGVLALSVVYFDVLLGVAPDSPLRLAPLALVLVLLAGVCWGLCLRRAGSPAYELIGTGEKARQLAVLRERAGVRSAEADEVDEVGAVIAQAFHDLPPSARLVPDPSRRDRVLGAFFAHQAGLALEGGAVDVVADERGRIVAAAVWHRFHHGQDMVPTDGEEQQLRTVLAAAGATEADQDRIVALGRFFGRNHPTHAEHDYLEFLAVVPDRQRQGLGPMVLKAHHDRLDGENRAAYLEATTPANERYYRRLGYLTRSGRNLPSALGGTQVALMWRKARQPTEPEAARARRSPAGR
ncbi:MULTISPECIES: GNAT family N-acetyltransferase [Actinosynnema]|uniref:GNAT family N-acetyltransferase n=1 Tax=Actinosynnema TaxID=40566 RepID=UPI0020A55BA7|nr:GNAT family N-acetyltransferase [Actinosynnema pretiosum]MCP2097410.1 Amino acid transporter [Actinosynnema pretiosum]